MPGARPKTHAAVRTSAASIADLFSTQRINLEHSWRRCIDRYGLDPSAHQHLSSLSRSELREHSEPLDEVLVLAREELDYVYAPLADASFGVSIANMTGLILSYRSPQDEGYVSTEREGTLWAEGVTGTNGVGTCVLERRPTQVFQKEHFFRDFSFLSCAAAPLLSADAEMIGVLNFTSGNPALREDTFRLVSGLAIKTAERLSNQLFARRFQSRTILKARLGEDATLLIAVDDDQNILGANQAARLWMNWRDGAVKAQSMWSVFEVERPGERLQSGPLLLQREGGTLAFEVRVADAPRFVPAPAVSRDRQIAKPAPRDATHTPSVADCLGSDPRLARSLRVLTKVSGSKLPILLLGETGAGKDTLARAIHAEGSRKDRPFVAFNCAAVPETLIDSELFGYGAGAFTGARREGNAGRLVEADGGVLFLDEIGDMPLILQTRLLRVLESGEVSPLGAGKTRHIEVQVIAATNHDLRQRVAGGTFREDLFHRLAGVVIDVLPLRERSDMHEVVDAMIARVAGERDLRLTDGAMAALIAHSWPGNMRELKFVLQRAVQICDDDLITSEDLLLHSGLSGGTPTAITAPSFAADRPSTAREAVASAERELIEESLARHRGEIDAAAAALNISRATLYRKLRQHGLRARNFTR
jgi:transcriptional regulator of acetoin/glycerol metabolism